MKKVLVIFAALAIALSLVGCNGSGRDVSKLKPIETHKVGDINVVLMNDTGELKQGRNDFVVQFQNQQGQAVDVGEVQLGSNMSMPAMAPMSGESEITPAGQTGTYRVKSNFAMSGAWHFTITWNGPQGQGKTAFNSNVR
jgi:predicted small secreted protein